jgi:catechol 2,3-dioxygenase-like lactoylglutathione lyase family enzyme
MTDTTPLITGVDFVCIPAQDFDAMTAFYGETLGLPFVKRYGSRPGAEYQAGNLTLAIMRTGTSKRSPADARFRANASLWAAARPELPAKRVRGAKPARARSRCGSRAP